MNDTLFCIETKHAITAARSFGGPIKTKEMCIMHTLRDLLLNEKRTDTFGSNFVMAVYSRQKNANVEREETLEPK